MQWECVELLPVEVPVSVCSRGSVSAILKIFSDNWWSWCTFIQTQWVPLVFQDDNILFLFYSIAMKGGNTIRYNIGDAHSPAGVMCEDCIQKEWACKVRNDLNNIRKNVIPFPNNNLEITAFFQFFEEEFDRYLVYLVVKQTNYNRHSLRRSTQTDTILAFFIRIIIFCLKGRFKPRLLLLTNPDVLKHGLFQ